jgi:phosphoribosylglycinamide formyltransferase-1
MPDDDETALTDRILAAEHRLYPLAVKLFARRRLRVEDERVVVTGTPASDTILLNPAEL